MNAEQEAKGIIDKLVSCEMTIIPLTAGMAAMEQIRAALKSRDQIIRECIQALSAFAIDGDDLSDLEPIRVYFSCQSCRKAFRLVQSLKEKGYQ